MYADIESNLARIESGKAAIITALKYIGINIPSGTKIDDIASYIEDYGVFRGTEADYTTAYNAGKIPVGSFVILDDTAGGDT